MKKFAIAAPIFGLAALVVGTVAAPAASAAPLSTPTNPYLIAEDGKYIGQLTNNRYDSESICSQYGDYGSKYSSTSITNKYSDYGSKYADYSAYNKYTSTPPRIINQQAFAGYLTKNKYLENAIDPDALFSSLNCPSQQRTDD
jgi:hypothetical protein